MQPTLRSDAVASTLNRTTELQPDKARRAQENFAEAGLADLIELREGDARETLSQARLIAAGYPLPASFGDL